MPAIEFSDGTILAISSIALKPIKSYLNKVGFKKESGGIMLGCWSSRDNIFFPTALTLPSVEDEGGPYHFVRAAKPAEKIIKESWKNSGGTVNYIGEWHTHNEDLPRPSSVDANLMRQVSDPETCLFDRAFMIIVGRSGKAFVGMVDPINGGNFTETKHVNLLSGE